MSVANAAACITDEDIARLNRPTERAVGLPREVCTSAELFELERDRVLANTWFCVGIAADIPNPGDLMPYDLAGIPLLLLRDKAANVRAFHNVCSHRGVQLVAESRNTRVGIVCPYHAWTYDRGGRLLRRPRFCGELHCPDDKFDPVALAEAGAPRTVASTDLRQPGRQCAATIWHAAPVWIHGDVGAGNLLVQEVA